MAEPFNRWYLQYNLHRDKPQPHTLQRMVMMMMMMMMMMITAMTCKTAVLHFLTVYSLCHKPFLPYTLMWQRHNTPVPSRTFSWVVTLAWPDPAPAAPTPFINNYRFHTASPLTGWPCCGKQLPSIWLVFLNSIVLTAALHVYSIRTMNKL